MIMPATMPPIDDPLSNSATAQPVSFFGNHSDTAFVAPGQLPASPRPERNLNPAKLFRPPANPAVSHAAREYQTTARLRPTLVPRRSSQRPATVCPTE